MKFNHLSTLVFLCINASYVYCQVQTDTNHHPEIKKSDILGTKDWLSDASTIPFGKIEREKCRNSFNGVRLLFEPQFGHIVQTVDNRIYAKDYNGLIKFGVETNVYKGYIAFQVSCIFPSTVQMDELSMIRANDHILDPSGRVDVDYGFAIGCSFFNGIIAVGYGGLFFDNRNFQNMENIPRTTFNFQNNFVYFAIQPISALKAVISNQKNKRE